MSGLKGAIVLKFKEQRSYQRILLNLSSFLINLRLLI